MLFSLKMKKAFRMIRRDDRGGLYYIVNTQTNERRSLGTTDKAQAKRLLDAENQARDSASLNMQLGVVYLRNADPNLTTRTWQLAMDELISHGKETSQHRTKRAVDSKAFDLIRNKPLVTTTSEDLKAVLKKGGSATNNYLRRLHNLALGNGWISFPIIAPKLWEKPAKSAKRGITLEEHEKIIAAEANEERRNYYQMLWEIGAAQTDCALLTAENIDWNRRVLSYQRKKTGEWSHLGIGPALETLLQKLPSKGYLFPRIATLKDKDRSAEFCRRRRLLELSKDISLHSYRYAWAERAYVAGYAERFAQAALGHKSRAVHYAYARHATVVCPPLDLMEKNIIPLSSAADQAGAKNTSPAPEETKQSRKDNTATEGGALRMAVA